jgi:protein-disulfide isomerase
VQPRATLPISNDGAKVLLVKFSDYQCPGCRATYFAYEPLLAKYKDRPKDFKYVLEHFPLSSECNPAVKAVVHTASCTAAAAVIMAGPKGTADKLNDWLFLHQDQLSPSRVRDAAQDVGGIRDFSADLPNALAEIRKEGELGGELKVDQTPTYFLNGRRIAPAITREAMEFLIELELKNGT